MNIILVTQLALGMVTKVRTIVVATLLVDVVVNDSRSLIPLFKSLFATTNPVPIKAALELDGWSVGAPRLPLTPLPEEMKTALSHAMAALRQT